MSLLYRHQCPITSQYLRSFSPFFFFSGLQCQVVASLAGDEKYKSKANHLSSLRQDGVRGLSKRYTQKEGQMPSVRQREKLERWEIKSAHLARCSAVLLQRLRLLIFRALATLPIFLPRYGGERKTCSNQKNTVQLK
jgi:hypothetical protein